jgi:small subunit ribosomal protein S17
MAEEENNEQVEETPEEETPRDDAGESTAEEAEAAAEPAAEEDAGGGDQPAAEGDAGDELADLPWKERRRLLRSREPSEARPQRGPEERQAERAQERSASAAARRRYRQARRGKSEGGTGTPAAERHPNAPKVRQGVVVSDKPDKTIVVRIDITRRHPTYEKIVRRSRTLHAHDERNEAGEGDTVRVVETRPLSRSKRWRLVDVIEKAR